MFATGGSHLVRSLGQSQSQVDDGADQHDDDALHGGVELVLGLQLRLGLCELVAQLGHLRGGGLMRPLVILVPEFGLHCIRECQIVEVTHELQRDPQGLTFLSLLGLRLRVCRVLHGGLRSPCLLECRVLSCYGVHDVVQLLFRGLGCASLSVHV